jgi:transposase
MAEVGRPKISLEQRLPKAELARLHWKEGKTCKEIAQMHNISVIYVQRLKTKYGIPTNRIKVVKKQGDSRKRLKSKITKDDFKRLYLVDKKTMAQIAEHYGFSRQSLIRYRKEFGIAKKTRADYEGFTLDENFFSAWTAPMAWVLGLVITDGCIGRQPSYSSFFLSFSSTNKELAEKMRLAMGSTHPIKEKSGERLSRYSVKTQHSLTIANQNIVQDLFKLGVTEKKSLTVKYPKVPSLHFRHFLRGIFEGDGSIYINGGTAEKPIYRVKFVSGSKDFIEGIKKCYRKK